MTGIIRTWIGAAPFPLAVGGSKEVWSGLQEIWLAHQEFRGRAGEASVQVFGCS
jgi:hypothetical protein